MRQVWITKPGPPETLQVRESGPLPQPGPGEVRVAVEAAGVNFADVMARLGIYPDAPRLPAVVGYEVAGRVDAVGPGVSPGWQGRPVLAVTRFGGYAEAVVVPCSRVFGRPREMDACVGAALPVNYLTAYQLLVAMGGLRSGQTVLIRSAAGGVGMAACQIALTLGARVIGTASPAKHDRLRALGVRDLLPSDARAIAGRVRDLTGGEGVDLALDPLGGRSFLDSYQCLAPTGRLGMFGYATAALGKRRSWRALAGSVARMPWLAFHPARLMNDNRGVFGVNMGRMWDQAPRLRTWMQALMTWYAEGKIAPHVDRVFAFDQTAAAHHYLQERRNVGKVVLVPR